MLWYPWLSANLITSDSTATALSLLSGGGITFTTNNTNN